MTYVIRAMLLVTAMALLPAASFAQGTSTAPAWFVGALGGATFGTAATNTAVGGQIGRRIASGLFVIGEVGRMQNVMPKEIDRMIDDLIDDFDPSVTFSLDVSAPLTYGFGGARWVPARGSASPFIEGGIGGAHVSLNLARAELFGVDVRELVLAAADTKTESTNALVAFGFGATGKLGRSVALDVGYRYIRVMIKRPQVHASMIYAAVKFGR